jgi:hypothetical protein
MHCKNQKVSSSVIDIRFLSYKLGFDFYPLILSLLKLIDIFAKLFILSKKNIYIDIKKSGQFVYKTAV